MLKYRNDSEELLTQQMIKSIIDVAVVVSDGKKAAEWYRDKLGLEVRDMQGHWITVAPKGSKEAVLHLCEEEPLEPGNTGIAFAVEDLDKAYEELTKKGVEFTRKPKKMDWGSSAMFKDPDGNEFWLYPE